MSSVSVTSSAVLRSVRGSSSASTGYDASSPAVCILYMCYCPRLPFTTWLLRVGILSPCPGSVYYECDIGKPAVASAEGASYAEYVGVDASAV